MQLLNPKQGYAPVSKNIVNAVKLNKTNIPRRSLDDIMKERDTVIDQTRVDEDSLYEKGSTTESDVLCGVLGNTLVSKVFFCRRNQQIIQNAIRKQIYDNSNQKYLISMQSEIELLIIMRSMYLQYSTNDDCAVTKQVEELNKLVVDYCIPLIQTNIASNLQYEEDKQKVYTVIDRPAQTSVYGSKLF